MKSLILIFFILITEVLFSQKNDSLIYSFKTVEGKNVVISENNNNVSFTYGKKDSLEININNKILSSNIFNYSYYLRGGGAQNEGLDLNYFYFTKANFKYVVYETYYAVDNSTTCGLKIINLKTNKIEDYKGNIASIKGSLMFFRDNEIVTHGDELFD